MGIFSGPSEWEIKALVIISAQLHDIQRKLDTLLPTAPNVTEAQLKELRQESAKLKAKSDDLLQAVERQQQEGKT